MKEQVEAYANKAWRGFSGVPAGQKAMILIAGVAIVIGGYFLATWSSAPTYAPLYTNLAASDASAIVDKLNTAGTPYRLTAAGTEIEVPQKDVYSTRLTVSAAGLPSSSQTGFPLLDKAGVTTSDFQQQIDYQSDLESQLDRTIDSLNGVQSAAVTLAIPQQNVFTDSNSKPTAGVLLTVAGGTTLTTSQVQSVVYLVSSSVPGMSADDVTVTDSNGNVLNAPGQGVTSASSASSQNQATQALDARLASQLQTMLVTALGPGNAQVAVNATLDFDSTNTENKTYVYNKDDPPVSQSTTSESYTGTGTPPTGTVGSTNANTDTTGTTTTGTTGTTTTGTSGNGTYTQTSNTVNNALGTQTTTTTSAPGQVKQLAIGVLLNQSAKGVDAAKIESMVKAAVGYNATRGDTISVTAMPFSTAQQQAASAATKLATKAAASSASQSKLLSEAKQGLLGLLVVGLVVGAWLASRKRRKNPVEDWEPDHDRYDGTDSDANLPKAGAAPMTGADVNELATQRRGLVAVADNRPQEFAQALSGWLNTREN
jgi:flagellar M-ring protein FliF